MGLAQAEAQRHVEVGHGSGFYLRSVILLLLIARMCSAPNDTVPFSSGELALRGGLLLPQRDLGEVFDPAPQTGASLAMNHWGAVRTRLDFAYARLTGVDPLHFALMAAGYDWRPRGVPLELGASLGIFYVWNRESPDTAWLSKDGETEFGLCIRGAFPVWNRGPWSLRAEAQLQEAFTNPEFSLFAWMGVSLAWRAW